MKNGKETCCWKKIGVCNTVARPPLTVALPYKPGGINPDHPSYGADLTILGQCSHRTAFALPLRNSNVKYTFPPLGARPFAAEKIHTSSAARRQPICGPKGFRFNLAPQTTISPSSGTMLPPRLPLPYRLSFQVSLSPLWAKPIYTEKVHTSAATRQQPICGNGAPQTAISSPVGDSSPFPTFGIPFPQDMASPTKNRDRNKEGGREREREKERERERKKTTRKKIIK